MYRYFLRLALRNLLRRRRRTVLTFLAVAVGLWYFIFLDSFLQGLGRDSVRNLVDLETSHVRLHAAGYWENRDELPLDRLVEQPGDLLARLRTLPGVEAVAPRLVFAAQVNNGTDELPVSGVGIDPAADARVFMLSRYVVEGRMPGEAGGSEAVLGRDLAELMELGVGDSFTLVMRTKNGALQAVDLTVAGLLNTPNPSVNTDMVFVSLATAQQALGVGEAVTEIDVRAPGPERAAALQATIDQAVFARVTTHTWRAMARDLIAMMEAERTYNTVFLALVFVIALVGVVNTVLLATLERTREIGMMKAMGMTAREITGLFMTEAGMLGVLAGVAGVLAAVATEFFFVNYGFDLTALMRDVDIGYPISGIFRGAWNPLTMAGAFVFGVAVCIVASVLPARRAASMDAAAALR